MSIYLLFLAALLVFATLPSDFSSFSFLVLIAIALVFTLTYVHLSRKRKAREAKERIERDLRNKEQHQLHMQTKGSEINPIDWNIRRNHVLRRDGNKCTKCGSTKDLHVHHIVPRSKIIDHSESNLITLCVNCHAQEDGHGEKVITSHNVLKASTFGFKKIKGRKDYRCSKCGSAIGKGNESYVRQQGRFRGHWSSGGERICIDCIHKGRAFD